jgi:hypothetical protein
LTTISISNNVQPIIIYYSSGTLNNPPNPNGIKKILIKLSHFFPSATLSQTGIGNKVIKVNGAHKRAISQSTRNGVNPFHEYKS